MSAFYPRPNATADRQRQKKNNLVNIAPGDIAPGGDQSVQTTGTRRTESILTVSLLDTIVCLSFVMPVRFGVSKSSVSACTYHAMDYVMGIEYHMKHIQVKCMI